MLVSRLLQELLWIYCLGPFVLSLLLYCNFIMTSYPVYVHIYFLSRLYQFIQAFSIPAPSICNPSMLCQCIYIVQLSSISFHTHMHCLPMLHHLIHMLPIIVSASYICFPHVYMLSITVLFHQDVVQSFILIPYQFAHSFAHSYISMLRIVPFIVLFSLILNVWLNRVVWLIS